MVPLSIRLVRLVSLEKELSGEHRIVFFHW